MLNTTKTLIFFYTVLTLALPVKAAVLPQDRVDIMYHAYDGGGAEIAGPSVLVLKQVGQKYAVRANYYVDSVTSASIDVITTASPYTEERTEMSVGFDYLRDKTILSLTHSTSQENDYDASTTSFGISQDFFGDLTTLSMGISFGSDEVGKRGDDNFSETIDRRNYRLGLTQVITPSLILNLTAETITDEGFLNNPYRSIRYLDSNSATGYSYASEVYPETRTSDAIALRAKYYLPYRAALKFEYRSYTDSWGISASNFELGYIHPLDHNWTLEGRYRFYDQTSADFYSDLFAYANAQNFLARDKELSTFSTNTLGIGITYEFNDNWAGFIEKSSLNLFWDFMQFEYEDFRDASVTAAPGEEPLYEFNANVIRFFYSVWF
ncbi:MAG: DUF3570 domain-containing protein [Cellvibrionaceae bacterium]